LAYLLHLKDTFEHENPPKEILDKIRGLVCDMFGTEDVGMWITKERISDTSEVSGLEVCLQNANIIVLLVARYHLLDLRQR
jgi:hypothetical protein